MPLESDLVGAMALQAVAAGVRLGLFEALSAEPSAGPSAEPRSAERLALDLGVPGEGLSRLLAFLEATGNLERADGGYRCTAQLDVMLVWQAILGELWADLAHAVRKDEPRGDFYSWLGGRPEVSARFQALQKGMASGLADQVVALVELPGGPLRLLDLGGGHGEYSAAFCRAHPGLTATVVDLPQPVRHTHRRIEWRVGDLRHDPLGAGHDVVLLCNVLHGFPAGQAAGIVARAAVAGERVVVVESRAGAGAFAAGFDLNLWHTQGGGLPTASQLADWLRAAGCDRVKCHEVGQHVVVQGSRETSRWRAKNAE
ncbi:methyltransferase [Nonomuraea sp. NPDC050663]|uniref:methyltransferase n=1 Tax=Nonomuraea sp. NPDC050663 TaxID=3364370 RepID=UPI00378A3426